MTTYTVTNENATLALTITARSVSDALNQVARLAGYADAAAATRATGTTLYASRDAR